MNYALRWKLYKSRGVYAKVLRRYGDWTASRLIMTYDYSIGHYSLEKNTLDPPYIRP